MRTLCLHGSPTSEGRLFHKKKKKTSRQTRCVWKSTRGSSRKKKDKNVQKRSLYSIHMMCFKKGKNVDCKAWVYIFFLLYVRWTWKRCWAFDVKVASFTGQVGAEWNSVRCTKLCKGRFFFFYVDSCIHDSTCDESHSNPSAFMIFCRVKFIGELATKERWQHWTVENFEKWNCFRIAVKFSLMRIWLERCDV